MAKIISLIVSIIIFFEAIPLAWVPTLEVDASKTLDEISTYATGFLYGLAEEGVPSKAMTDSIDISSVSAKVIDGLQHPTGDVDNVASQLESCDYRVVYLQDSFDTWYYCYDEIMELRKAGTYDWRVFLEERYLPLVKEKVTALSQKDYADDIVYCIFNECDNAVWFGNYVQDENGNYYTSYDETGRANFYEAWKITYDLVKSIDPDAIIGGPGFCDYETTKMEGFMDYCAANSCVPEIIIYHELAYWSIPDWHLHVEDLRRIENKLSLNEHQIIVTEYGTMEDCGNPATMVHYIMAMERSNVYGNMAFWRLANNLNDTCADDNSPNSNWWLYRKYAEMEGTMLETSSSSQTTYNYRDRLDGIAAITDDGERISMLVSASDEKSAVKLINLDETNLGRRVDVKIECVYYKGLTGIVSDTTVLKQYTASVSCGKLNINIPETDDDAVYFVTVSAHDDDIEIIRNTNIPVRYEFEDGTLIGKAYTYDSAYATTGNQYGMCGGFENDGDGVKITVKAESEGYYDLDVIFGNSNDGSAPADRDYTEAYFTLDGAQSTVTFENTIKSEYTSCKTLRVYLSKGTHTIEFAHKNGTFVLDSLVMTKADNDSEIALLGDSADGSAFLAVAPYDGYYKLSTNGVTASVTIDGAQASVSDGSLIYLRRGLNEIVFNQSNMNCSIYETVLSEDEVFTETVDAADITLSGTAALNTDKYGTAYISGITSDSGSGSFTVTAPKAADYRVTVLYSNNAEGGVHSYNVDLIESYMTVTANGESQDVYCRNTYSWFTYKTVTFNISLAEGKNVITLTNSGNEIFNNTPAIAPQIQSITINAVNS